MKTRVIYCLQPHWKMPGYLRVKIFETPQKAFQFLENPSIFTGPEVERPAEVGQ